MCGPSDLAFSKLALQKTLYGCTSVRTKTIRSIRKNCNSDCLRPEAEKLIAQYRRLQSSPRAVFVQTDMTSWAALTQIFEVALEEFIDFHIVCPGAGIYEPHWSNFWHPRGSPESKDSLDSNYYYLLDINLTHPIRTTQLALSYWLHLRSRPSSFHPVAEPVSPENSKHIIHISSVAGQIPNFNTPIYSTSKFTITGFIRCLAPLDQAICVQINATEHPEKLLQLDQEKDGWATADEVAMEMLRCVDDENLEGGAILEVGKNSTRRVEVLNDPGPDESLGTAFKASKAEEAAERILYWLRRSDIWG
ncbi:hypothetical protein ASPTUDRAFT_59422 [Aspergillus tubingensis CBS 134.48]|uniref:Uncharacterized protein n=1 Tax=Aspergillus tubingensis (strain CBS 134.48) TaxID=767770 RepID=A0A1L9MQI8_ASPTC|nr:hypothetical protein ASPTUDRAFT_59422 [Aspergillus tubingensis CBS 134.48]